MIVDGKRILRVFPRKTHMTPRDEYAFIGLPPLDCPAADEVHISVVFKRDIETALWLQREWSARYSVVKIGGPAFGYSESDTFIPGLYVAKGVVFTSRGCPRKCPWCLVPELEGSVRTLPIVDGWIVQDNNLLATPIEHQSAVFDMLRRQRRCISFPGGLDTRLMDDRVLDELRSLKTGEIFLAADSDASIRALGLAVEKLSTFLSRRKLRCYTMIGFDGETLEQARNRLNSVWDIGCLPFAQLYQPADGWIGYPQEWQDMARTWSRPAAMYSLKEPKRCENAEKQLQLVTAQDEDSGRG